MYADENDVSSGKSVARRRSVTTECDEAHRQSLIANDSKHKPLALGSDLDPIATVEPELLQPNTRHANERHDRLPPPIPTSLAMLDLPVQRHLLGNIGVTTAVDANAEHGPITLTIAQQQRGPLPLPDDLVSRRT